MGGAWLDLDKATGSMDLGGFMEFDACRMMVRRAAAWGLRKALFYGIFKWESDASTYCNDPKSSKWLSQSALISTGHHGHLPGTI